MSPECLYLISSNAKDLYLQDAVNTLSQPDGTIVHYRYEEKYLSSSVKGADRSVITNGLPVLLSLLDYRYAPPQAPLGPSNPPAPGTLENGLFPLRHGEIVGFERYEGTVHFWIALRKQAQVNDQAAYAQLVDEVIRNLGTDLPSSSIFAALASPPALRLGTPEMVFKTIVTAISSACLDPDRLAFVNITEVSEITKDGSRRMPLSNPSVRISSDLPPITRYRWQPNRSYVVGFSWFIPSSATLLGTDGSSLILQIDHDSSQLVVEGQSQWPLTGRYDRGYLFITPRAPNKSVQTTLTFKVVQQDGKLPPTVQPRTRNGAVLGLNYTAPILIVGKEGLYRGLTVTGDVLVAFGGLLVGVVGALVRWIPDPTTSAAPGWLVFAATYPAVLLLSAGAFTFLGGGMKAWANGQK